MSLYKEQIYSCRHGILIKCFFYKFPFQFEEDICERNFIEALQSHNYISANNLPQKIYL